MIQASIGLCVKNSEKIVKEAIDEIVMQNFPKKRMEIIVVDDGGKDNTLSVIMNVLSKTDIRTRVYSTGGRGLGVGRQMVVDNASGKYIIWVDDDMIISKDFVKKEVEFMEQNPHVGVSQGVPIIVARQRKPHHKSVLVALENLSLMPIILSNKEPKYLGTGGSIFRLDAIRQVGGFDPRIKGAAEDTDLTIRMKKAGWSLARVNAEHHHKIILTLKGLFVRNSWHGYGSHYISHKHRGIYGYFWLQIPPVAFLIGLRRSLKIYKLTRRKISFLLPFYLLWESLAWCNGFFKGHADGYGHDS